MSQDDLWSYVEDGSGSLDLRGFRVAAADALVGVVGHGGPHTGDGYLLVEIAGEDRSEQGPADTATRPPVVVLPAGQIDAVDLDARLVTVTATRERILAAPRPSDLWHDAGYLADLAAYYQRST